MSSPEKVTLPGNGAGVRAFCDQQLMVPTGEVPSHVPLVSVYVRGATRACPEGLCGLLQGAGLLRPGALSQAFPPSEGSKTHHKCALFSFAQKLGVCWEHLAPHRQLGRHSVNAEGQGQNLDHRGGRSHRRLRPAPHKGQAVRVADP